MKLMNYSQGMATSPTIAKKVESFFSDYPIKDFAKGEILIFADENPSHIFYILSGQVKQYDITKTGEEVVVNIFKKPSFMPLISAIGEVENTFFFEAATSIRTRKAPTKDVISFLKNNPEVTYDLLRRLYSGVNGLLKRNAYLMAGHARSRLAFELLIEAQRFGTNLKEGIMIILSEAELGSRAGLTRETVSRELTAMKKMDILTIGRKGILITNISGLKKLLASDF